MKKQLVLLIFALSISVSLHAQQVISSAGEDFIGENVTVSWTLGEPVIETLSNNSIVLTQGFQQGFLSSNSIKELFKEKLNLEIYPNPTLDNLNVHVKSQDFFKLNYYLHSMDGRVISQGSLQSDLTKIDLERYSHGVYLLRVIKESGEAVQFFRVVRQ